MKYLLLILIFLFLSCKSESNLVENQLYNCLMNSLSVQEKEMVQLIISEFEEHLIRKGILETSTASGYWNFYKKIAETGVYKYSNGFNFQEKISFLNRENYEENHSLIECQNEVLKSEEYLKSKQYELKKELISLKKHQVTEKMIAQTMINYLTVEDFELKYNRLMTLMYIDEANKKFK